MKASSSLATLSFLLQFALLNTLPLLGFSKVNKKVVDPDGNPIGQFGGYYIKPSVGIGSSSGGGGLRLIKTGNSSCPVTVLQDSNPKFLGLPVTFVKTQKGPSILTGDPLEISFTKEDKPECASSPKWSVFEDKEIGKAYLGIGGPEDHPGQQQFSGTFNIQILAADYKIVFCVPVLSTCFDVGRFHNNEGGRRFVLTTNEPFNLNFRSASNPNNGTNF